MFFSQINLQNLTTHTSFFPFLSASLPRPQHVVFPTHTAKVAAVCESFVPVSSDTSRNSPAVQALFNLNPKKKKKKKKRMNASDKEDAEIDATATTSNADNAKSKKKKNNKKTKKEAEKRGVCYLSRIPPHMDHVKLRHILSQFGDIQRIFLAPQDSAALVKRSRGSRDQAYSEGWVEFTNKIVAKRVANMLNGEQIGGKKRSSFYYDLWNIKYLSKFKWDDLTEELALKKATREQKLAVELSAAKRERDFYLSKVDQSRALSAIEERLKKKQKVQQDSGPVAKVIRHFPQTKPITSDAKKIKPEISDDILDAVFGGS
ncbi:esf2, partial [Mucuna pruriens]